LRAILLICDGMADLPNPNYEGRTPLQVAYKQNFDNLASEGICGMLQSVGGNRVPGSDTAHLAIFGYSPDEHYTGRGIFEALGAGVGLKKGDIAFRCNFATVKRKGKDFVVLDRRAGRISTVDAKELGKALDGMVIDGVQVMFKPTTEHRAALILRGKGLSWKVSDIDPSENNLPIALAKPLDNSSEAAKTARVINKFAIKSYEVLCKQKLNVARIRKGQVPATMILVRSGGTFEKLQPITEKYGIKVACIAGGALCKGVAAYVGMDVVNVPGATGGVDTDLNAKAKAAIKALSVGYDLVFLHVKATDTLSHDGNFRGKVNFIEKIDALLGKLMNECGKDTYIAVTSDHTTSCMKKRHSHEPAPIAVWGPFVRSDSCRKLDEFECSRGGLGHMTGSEVMPMLMDLMNKAKKFGA